MKISSMLLGLGALAFGAGLWLLPASAQDPAAPDSKPAAAKVTTKHRVLIELFTSQG